MRLDPFWKIASLLTMLILSTIVFEAKAFTGDARVSQWAPTVKREGQAYLGLNSPTPMFLGQIKQESSGNEKVTASDGGMGLTQFMPGTVAQISKTFPELGAPSPYDPKWSIRAQVRYDSWLYKRVKGDNACEAWSAVLTGYNAGLGYVQRAQKKSDAPGTWYEKTELIETGQTKKNYIYSRKYPRWIIFKHQPHFIQYGNTVCNVNKQPIDNIK